MADEQKAMTTTGAPGALAQQEEPRPDYIDVADKTGKEGISKDDLRFPRIAIAQGLSPQMLPGDSQHIEGLTMFQMFNELTQEIYGMGPLRILPLHRQVVRIEFDPEDRKVVLDRNVPANDPRMQWGPRDPETGEADPPRGTKFTEIICLVVHDGGRDPEMAVISIKETNKFMRRAAERITTFISLQDGPIFGTFKYVESKAEKNDEGTFGVYTFRNADKKKGERKYPEKDLYEYAQSLATQLRGLTIDVNREGGDEAGAPAPGDAPPAGNDDPTAFDTDAMDAEVVEEQRGPEAPEPTEM
jgi:hypothetical protein